MKFRPFLLPTLALATLLLTGRQTKAGQENETATATLLWTGEIAADGCGFELMIDDKEYLPANEDAIAESFKNSHSTQVQLEFVRLQEPIDRQYGMLPQPRVLDAVRVISIKPLQ